MTRKEKKTYASDLTTAFFEIETVLEIWATNSTLTEKNATLDVTTFELNSDWTESWKKDVVLLPNAATELYKGDLPGQPKRTKASEVPRTIVISARLLDSDGSVLGRYSNW
jgi:beta-mannosidase